MLTGKAATRFLRSIIEDIDSGRTPARPRTPLWVRRVAGPAAVGLALGVGGVAGCVGGEDGGGEVTRDMAADAKADGWTDHLCEQIGAPRDCDICAELDWYGDGEFCDDFCDLPDPDCDEGCSSDGDCAENEHCNIVVGECPEGAYCILPPTPGTCEPRLGGCSDGVDNDGDRAVDCSDSDCFADPACIMVPLYGVPMVENCSNDVDDDYDGAVDCDDTDCVGDPACTMVPLYGVPLIEDCDDERDNDGDGLVDCADPDCAYDDDCGPVPEYAVPFEFDCDDERDNDGDGLVDCDDADCDDDPACGGVAPLYAAPMD